MRLKIVLFLIVILFNQCSMLGSNDKKDETTRNNFLALFYLSQLPQLPQQGEIKFNAILNNKAVECGDTTYTLPGGQTVQMRDFRFFVQDIRLVNYDGSKTGVSFNQVDNYQYVEGSNQVGLLDFTKVGSGRCTGTSDDASTNTKIAGSFKKGVYKGLEIDIGVPGAFNHRDSTKQASTNPLKSGTGLTWAWTTGYKFVRFELTATATNFVLHLGSTNCSGDSNIEFGNTGAVSCSNSYRPTIVIEPNGGFNPDTDTITIDADEFFKGNGGVPTSSYTSGTALSCMPIGNGSGNNGNASTCGPILKNLGLKPGSQAGFSSSLVSETGVGTVDLTTQQPIFKVIK